MNSPLPQTFSMWCFAGKGHSDEQLLAAAQRIGYTAVDLAPEALWPLAADAGLKVSGFNGHASIEQGMNHPDHAARIEREVRDNIAKAHARGIPVLVCFSGNRDGQNDETGLAQCAELLGRLAPEAAQAGVTLAMELLNSKVDHKDYQCDHTAWGVALCERVGSPAVKLLYDIYHMQVMEGDVIRTIGESHDSFAHYHTAGNPGRGPMDADQELNYPAIYRAIAATGYTGYIGHEFLPAGDPIEELERAYTQCAASFA